MGGYVKVFGSILDSTIWLEDSDTRCVWLTMLAMKDRDQIVHASLPGIARRANVSLQAAERAIAVLSSPDEHSRTKVEDGRRIVVADGGWRVVNGAMYRDLLSVEDAREKARIRQATKRARDRDGGVTGSNGHDLSRQSRDPDPSSSTDPTADPEGYRFPSGTSPLDAARGFAAAWLTYPHHGQRSRKTLAERAWKARKLDAITENVLAWIEHGKASEDWRRKGGQYVPGMQVWLKGHDFSEPPPTTTRMVDRNMRLGAWTPPLDGGPCSEIDCGHAHAEHELPPSGERGLRCRTCPCQWYSAAGER